MSAICRKNLPALSDPQNFVSFFQLQPASVLMSTGWLTSGIAVDEVLRIVALRPAFCPAMMRLGGVGLWDCGAGSVRPLSGVTS